MSTRPTFKDAVNAVVEGRAKRVPGAAEYLGDRQGAERYLNDIITRRIMRDGRGPSHDDEVRAEVISTVLG